jgi:hypothetical protein
MSKSEEIGCKLVSTKKMKKYQIYWEQEKQNSTGYIAAFKGGGDKSKQAGILREYNVRWNI